MLIIYMKYSSVNPFDLICLLFTQDKNTLLVFCQNGEVMEVTAPEPGSYDTSKTFNITGLEIRRFTFNSIKISITITVPIS